MNSWYGTIFKKWVYYTTLLNVDEQVIFSYLLILKGRCTQCKQEPIDQKDIMHQSSRLNTRK